jgi:hypothetical protein
VEFGSTVADLTSLLSEPFSQDLKMLTDGTPLQQILAVIADHAPDGMPAFVTDEEVHAQLPQYDLSTIREHLYDAIADDYVTEVRSLSETLRVKATQRTFNELDPIAHGWSPVTDAGRIARKMLELNEGRAAILVHQLGFIRRRFNPAFSYLLRYLDDRGLAGFISREIQPEYPAAAVVLTDRVKAALRRFAREFPSGVVEEDDKLEATVTVEPIPPAREEITLAHQEMLDRISKLDLVVSELSEGQTPGIGHNGPPGSVEADLLGETDHTALSSALTTLKNASAHPGEAAKAEASRAASIVRATGVKIWSALAALAGYAGKQADTFFSEAIKSAGSEVGKRVV